MLKRTLSGAVLAAVMVGAILWSPLVLWILTAVIVTGSLLEYYRLAGVKPAAVLPGLVWIVLPMALLPLLGMQEDGYAATQVLFYVILVWINDIGAYLVGVSIGRHKLCPRISPKKSWEGFFGGLIFTVLAAVFLGPRMTGLETVPVWGWIVFGVVLTLSAVAGDLLESAFKRKKGVKDSGTIIPGHGGFLDRFDAMFLSLPFVYVLKCLVI